MNQKGFVNIILALAIIILIGAVGYFTFVKKSELVNQTLTFPTTSQDETANWKMYRNEKYGFELRYPSKWHLLTGVTPIREERNEEEIQRVADLNKDLPAPRGVPDDDELIININIYNSLPKGDTFYGATEPKKYLEELKKRIDNASIGIIVLPGEPKAEERILEVAGTKALRLLNWSSQWGGYDVTLRLFDKTGNLITLTTYLKEENTLEEARTENRNVIFDKIISTIKFISSSNPIPTPSPTPTPAPAKKIDLRSSLLAVTNLHLKDAEVIATGIKLFEAETSISPEEINTGNIFIQHVSSFFVLPNEDVKYIRVNEWFENQAKRNYATSSENFIVRICSGGAPPPPEFGCGQPTGESEPHEKHLPISGWTIDSKALGRILKENSMGSSRGGKIVVTTVGRLKSKYSEFFPQSLAQLPNGQSVIEFIEVGITGASTNFFEIGQYIVLDAKNGKVLAKGNYKLFPPAP